MERSGDNVFSSQIWAWAVEHIAKIVARYRALDAEELRAELTATLLELRQDPPPNIRDWKGYLSKCFLNRASRLVQQWRAQRGHEILTDFSSTEQEPVVTDDTASTRLEVSLEWAAVRDRISRRDRAFLSELADCDGNMTRLARRLGRHRNTIRRRLEKIRRGVCPTKVVSEPDQVRIHSDTRLVLTPSSRAQLQRLVHARNARVRDIRRARIILSMADGLTYLEIAKRCHASPPTIARWRRRFEASGVAGLRSQHSGRKPSSTRRRFLRWLSRTERPTGSLRTLAVQFGLGKSTIHRLLKAKKRCT